MSQHKNKNYTKKQKVDYRLGDLVPKTNTKTKINSADMHTETTITTKHIPVLLDAVLAELAPQHGESYLDLTAGYGGHAGEIIELTKSPERTTLVDRDQMAIDALTELFGTKGVEIIKSDFYTATRELHTAGKQFDVILADLGISSPHVDIASRGFAFMQDGPLDMRMDQAQSLTAADIVNTYKHAELKRILKDFGEEPRADRIASRIIEHRPFQTTTELAKVVASAYPKYTRAHPATKTFQALRIAVNDELELLRNSLPLWLELLAPGGRLGIISFHSLEDRIVKKVFKDVAGDRYDTDIRDITRKPISASDDELVFNPRARSAKLRAVAKIKNKEREEHANSG